MVVGDNCNSETMKDSYMRSTDMNDIIESKLDIKNVLQTIKKKQKLLASINKNKL